MQLRRIVRVVVVLLVAAGVVVYLGLDRFLKRTVESESTRSLKLATTLDSARLSLLGGKLKLNELRIASPHGFSAPHMHELGGIDVSVRYGELGKKPIHVQSLVIDRPQLVIEQSNGALNFKKAMDALPPGQSSSDEPIRMVIDELRMEQARIVVRPGLPGVSQELAVAVPSITVRSVGSGSGSRNGAAIKDVAMVVISALAKSAAESGSLPPQVKALLQLDARQVAAKLGAEVEKQVTGAVPGELGKDVQGELGGILGGKRESGSAGRPSTPPKR